MARTKRPTKVIQAFSLNTTGTPVVETPPDDSLNERAAIIKDVGISFIEESFREFCATPAGVVVLDTRLPNDHVRLYGELEDRLRVAFTAGLNLEG